MYRYENYSGTIARKKSAQIARLSHEVIKYPILEAQWRGGATRDEKQLLSHISKFRRYVWAASLI